MLSLAENGKILAIFNKDITTRRKRFTLNPMIIGSFIWPLKNIIIYRSP
jgi:hypothetical protein